MNFGYGINCKYEGMPVHSFDRFYVVTKFYIAFYRGSKIFQLLNYDNTCTYTDNKDAHNTDTRKYMLDLRTFCKMMEPFVNYYKSLIKSYNHTAHNILENEINLILPQVPRKQKCAIITTLVCSFMGLAYEGISSFLHHRCIKALHKAINAMDDKANIQHNKLMQLENSMLMCGIYNAETLEKLIKTVHDIHNTTSSHERLFVGQHSSNTFKLLYAHSLGLHHYCINSLLYLRTIQDKYITIYRELISQLCIYASVIRILAKGYLPNTLVTPSKLKGILSEVSKTLQVTNPDYGLVIDRLHLYYDMQLVTFGIDKDKNLIVQFPVFVQPYTQQALILYQLETVPVPILDPNDRAYSDTHLQVEKPYIALISKSYISLWQQELRTCKKTGCEFYCKELFVVKHKTRYSCERCHLF